MGGVMLRFWKTPGQVEQLQAEAVELRRAVAAGDEHAAALEARLAAAEQALQNIVGWRDETDRLREAMARVEEQLARLPELAELGDRLRVLESRRAEEHDNTHDRLDRVDRQIDHHTEEMRSLTAALIERIEGLGRARTRAS